MMARLRPEDTMHARQLPGHRSGRDVDADVHPPAAGAARWDFLLAEDFPGGVVEHFAVNHPQPASGRLSSPSVTGSLQVRI